MKPLALVLSLLLVGASFLVAQDAPNSDEAIFGAGAFEQAVDAGKAAEETNKLTWLGGVTLASDSSLTAPTTGATYGSQSLFSGKGFLKATKPEVGSLFLSYSLNHTLFSAATDPGLRSAYLRAQPSLDQPRYALSEFHLSFDVNKVAFVRVGNQLLNWGSSFFWSPADFVNQRPADSQAAVDSRTGKPGIRVHVPFGGVGVPQSNLFVFTDFSQSLTASGVPQDLVETGVVAARLDTTVAGVQLGVLGSGGRRASKQAGITFSGRFLGADLWGEYAAVLPLDGAGYRGSASLGGEKSWGVDSDWTLRAEGFFHPSGHDDTKLDAVALGSFTPFYYGKAYSFASITKAKALGTGIAASLSGLANLSDQSWQATSSLAFSLAKLIPFTLSVKYNGGPEAREFTYATGGPAWTLGLRSVVEF